jgi:hypothetical protein
MSITPFFIGWCVLGVPTAGLALYRKFVSMREDDLVHIGEGEEKLIPNQIAIGHKLTVVDRWGKTLTILTGVYGLLLAGAYLYQGWVETSH